MWPSYTTLKLSLARSCNRFEFTVQLPKLPGSNVACARDSIKPSVSARDTIKHSMSGERVLTTVKIESHS